MEDPINIRIKVITFDVTDENGVIEQMPALHIWTRNVNIFDIVVTNFNFVSVWGEPRFRIKADVYSYIEHEFLSTVDLKLEDASIYFDGFSAKGDLNFVMNDIPINIVYRGSLKANFKNPFKIEVDIFIDGEPFKLVLDEDHDVSDDLKKIEEYLKEALSGDDE